MVLNHVVTTFARHACSLCEQAEIGTAKNTEEGVREEREIPLHSPSSSSISLSLVSISTQSKSKNVQNPAETLAMQARRFTIILARV